MRKAFQQQGDDEAVHKARAIIDNHASISLGDKERLIGYLEGTGKQILPEPQALLTPHSKMPGLDGQKMSKSYNNTISLRAEPAEVETKISKMPTDPARVRLTDPGDPEKCPVWQLHQVYSDEAVKSWVVEGCTTASIGCLECKRPVIDGICAELKPIQQRAKSYQEQPEVVKGIILEGNDNARTAARETMLEVREAMGLLY
jgi:tryptophanyl-tRNA synthetase